MRKVFKYTLRALGALVLVILISALLLPLVFKKQILEAVRRAVDNRIEGGFYFEKAQLGLLRTFPNLCLSLDSPVLTGSVHPDGDSLYSAKSLDVIVDVKSLLRRNAPIKVTGIKMIDPKVSLFTDTAGISNYQLVADRDTLIADTSTQPLIVEIEDYRIKNGTVSYIDKTTGLDLHARNFDHRGGLRYEGDRIELSSSTTNAIVTLIFEGIAYLDSVHVKGTNDLDLDMANSIYRLIQNNISLNAMEVDIDGVIGQEEAKTNFDLTFAGARNSFKNLVSLLPNIYSGNFAAIEADGKISMAGSLKGELTETTVPVYNLMLNVEDGTFQYPGKPFGFSEIALQGKLINTTSGWTPAEIDLPSFHFLLNNRPFDLTAHILDPADGGNYEGTLKGVLDLHDFYQAYPLPEIQLLEGVITADAEFDFGAARTVADQHATGQLTLNALHVTSAGEDLQVQNGRIDFTPTSINLSTQSASWNASALQTSLNITNYIGWLTSEQLMTIAGAISLDELDLNKYISATEAADEQTSSFAPSMSRIVYDGSLAVNSLLYDTYIIQNGSTSVKGSLPSLEIERLQARINGTAIRASGHLRDIHRYMDGVVPLSGSFVCNIDTLFIDRWIETDDSSAGTASSGYVQLPGDMIFDISFDADGLLYDQLRIQQATGVVRLEDHVLEIHEFKGRGLGGQMAFSGVYNTQNASSPAFSLKYDLKSIRFAEAFKQVTTFKALAPVAQHLQGAFNSTLVMEGKLGDNYIPDFNSLNASGYIETLTAALQNLDVFEKVSQFLNLKTPLRWDLENTRNWFEVKNGYVILQEATKKIDDIEVSLGGRHRIQGEMDYLLKFKIPADRISSNPVGALAKAGYEELQKKAASYGVKLHTIESFVAHVGMKGTLRDPQFNLLLFDASGKSLKEVAAEQLIDIKEQVEDTLKAIADEKIEAVKDSIRDVIDQAVDSARKEAEERIREAGKEILSGATERLDSTLRDSITQAVLDKMGDKAMDKIGQKETDKIKDALDKWDPFKKKKNQ